MTSIDTIGIQINKIEDSLSLIDNTVKFHLTMQLTVLTFVVAAAGGALYIMAKHWVDKGLEKRVLAMKKELLEEVERKIPKVNSMTLTIRGTFERKNAVRVQVVGDNVNITPQLFIQPNGNHGDLEVHSILNTHDYIVINKKPYSLSFNVLVINGSIKLGVIPSYTEEEAMELVTLDLNK